MEATEEDHPSLPPNYVSLADLQQRWLKQQDEKERRKNQQCPPQQLLNQIGGDDAMHKQQNKSRKREKLQPQLPHKDRTGVENVKGKPQIRNSNPNQRPFLGNLRDKKGEKGKSVAESMPSKIEGDVAAAAEIDGGHRAIHDQVHGEKKSEVEKKIKKKKKKWDKKKQQIPGTDEQKPATEERNASRNGECGEERETGVKEGGGIPLKRAVWNPTVEIEEKLKKVNVNLNGRVWKSNGRSRLVFKAPNRMDGVYGGGEYREMKKAGRENGECSEERHKEVKEGAAEAPPLRPAMMSDGTVEIEEKMKKPTVTGRVWKSNGRSRVSIEGASWMHRGCWRVECRGFGMSKRRTENGLEITGNGGGERRGFGTRNMRGGENVGLAWVKKGEVAQQSTYTGYE